MCISFTCILFCYRSSITRGRPSIQMSSSLQEPSTSASSADYGGAENRSYMHSSSDAHLPTLDEEGDTEIPHPLRAAKGSMSSFPAVVEVSGTTTGPPRSASTSSFSQHHPRRTSVQSPHERQLSILDPMSDRVSTILVWQNLTVQAREDKRTEFFKRMKSYKNFVPKRKSLLHNTSGAITGGLWAVMGESSLPMHSFTFNLARPSRSIGLGQIDSPQHSGVSAGREHGRGR